MKTKVLKSTKIRLTGMSVNIAVMSVFLILGLVVGVIFAKNGDATLLREYVGNDFAEITQTGMGDYSFSKTFFNLSKYPLFLFLSAFCAFGVITIPLIVFARGFLISLSVSSLIATFGKSGILYALAAFGIQTFLHLPILLLISAISFENSKVFSFAILPQKYKFPTKSIKFSSFLAITSSCFLILLLISFVDFLITPKVISLVLKTLFVQ